MKPGQIVSADIVGFLTDQGLFDSFGFTAVASKDGKLPVAPDKVVVVTQTGGPGVTTDGTIDNVSFQFRVRGGQRDLDSAESMAWAIDGLLCPLNPLPGGMIGSQFVTRISRVGGPPAFFIRDSAERAHYTGNYIFAVARTTLPV